MSVKTVEDAYRHVMSTAADFYEHHTAGLPAGDCVGYLVCAAIDYAEALRRAPTSPAVVGEEGWCPQCGHLSAIDEDGCCPSCGADSIGPGATKALVNAEKVARYERGMRSLLDEPGSLRTTGQIMRLIDGEDIAPVKA